MHRGVAILDQRSLQEYCDPRLLVEWARSQSNCLNITLTVRSRALEVGELKYPAFAYTLGSIPLHPLGSPKFSDKNVWQKLAEAERKKRELLGFPMPLTEWGGRNEVGGSSWNDAVIMTPEDVIDCVIGQLLS
ncbi:MAG: hypothetical protein AAFO04_21855 [Cyanobacteria bacterium J06592_8]